MANLKEDPNSQKEQKEQADRVRARRRLLSYAAEQWRMLALALFFFVVGAAAEPVLPAMFKKLLDSGFQEGLKYPLWIVPVIVIGLFVVRGFFNFAGAYVMNRATSQMVLDLRTRLMRALLRADAHLFTSVGPGVAVSKVINDPAATSQLMGNAIITVVRDAATLLFLIGYLVYINWQLTLMAFVSMPLLGLSVRLVQKRLRKVGQEQYQSQIRLASAVDDNARAWRVVRSFNAVDFELHRFEQEAQHNRSMTMKQVVASALVTPLTQVVAAIGISIILTLALWQASQGQATVGEFVSFITALLMCLSPMRHLTDVFQPINQALIIASNAFQLLDAPAEPDKGTADMPTCRGDITFNNVTLQYEEASSPALNGLNLHIPAGQTIALVGASGAGKSTVVSTLLRFANPQAGQVLIDGQAIENLRLSSLRQHFAVVSQDIVLFDGSVAENVAYAGQSPLDRAKVEACLKAANLWQHIQTLPEGMDATVGTNGSKFSGGQRQRLAIARALYRDAAIWIFDEATSALDSESEAVVQRSIEALRGSKTLILIAHRLSTIRNADGICVMADGKVVEQGTHADLMLQNGLYAGMVRIQSAD